MKNIFKYKRFWILATIAGVVSPVFFMNKCGNDDAENKSDNSITPRDTVYITPECPPCDTVAPCEKDTIIFHDTITIRDTIYIKKKPSGKKPPKTKPAVKKQPVLNPPKIMPPMCPPCADTVPAKPEPRPTPEPSPKTPTIRPLIHDRVTFKCR